MFQHPSLTATRTPDLHIFLAEKMRMGVFGPEHGEISAFLYGKNVEEIRRKCGWEYLNRNTEKSPHSYMERKCGGNAEKMRMGLFGQEWGEISALYPHFSHNTGYNAENISAFPILRIPAAMQRILRIILHEE